MSSSPGLNGWETTWETWGSPFVRGLIDSVRIREVLVFVLSSTRVSKRFFQCIVLNGVIFIGSVVLLNYILTPIIRLILGLPPTEVASDTSLPDSTLPSPGMELISSCLSLLYMALWVCPIYLLGFVLNTIWYQEIADAAYEFFRVQDPHTSLTRRSSSSSFPNHLSPPSVPSRLPSLDQQSDTIHDPHGRHPENTTNTYTSSSSSSPSSSSSSLPLSSSTKPDRIKSPSGSEGASYRQRMADATTASVVLTMVTEEVYRLFVVVLFVIQYTVLAWVVPILGQPLMTAHVCILYAYYSFEYRFTAEAWPLDARLRFFEHRVAYFLGFGCLLAMATLLFGTAVSLGVFAVLLPIWIILAMHAPIDYVDPGPRVPVFYVVRWLNGKWLGALQRWRGTSTSRSRRKEASSSHASH